MKCRRTGPALYDLELEDPIDVDALEAAYNEATNGGTGTPEMAFCLGQVVNILTKTNDYDPDKLYLITEHGITEWEDND